MTFVSSQKMRDLPIRCNNILHVGERNGGSSLSVFTPAGTESVSL